MAADASDPFRLHVPRYDHVFTYGGGPPVVGIGLTVDQTELDERGGLTADRRGVGVHPVGEGLGALGAVVDQVEQHVVRRPLDAARRARGRLGLDAADQAHQPDELVADVRCGLGHGCPFVR